MHVTIRQTNKTQLAFVRDYYGNLLNAKWALLELIDSRKENIQTVAELIISMARLTGEMKRVDGIRHSLCGFK